MATFITLPGAHAQMQERAHTHAHTHTHIHRQVDTHIKCAVINLSSLPYAATAYSVSRMDKEFWRHSLFLRNNFHIDTCHKCRLAPTHTQKHTHTHSPLPPFGSSHHLFLLSPLFPECRQLTPLIPSLSILLLFLSLISVQTAHINCISLSLSFSPQFTAHSLSLPSFPLPAFCLYVSVSFHTPLPVTFLPPSPSPQPQSLSLSLSPSPCASLCLFFSLSLSISLLVDSTHLSLCLSQSQGTSCAYPGPVSQHHARPPLGYSRLLCPYLYPPDLMLTSLFHQAVWMLTRTVQQTLNHKGTGLATASDQLIDSQPAGCVGSGESWVVGFPPVFSRVVSALLL